MKTFSDLEFIELDQYMDGVAARIMLKTDTVYLLCVIPFHMVEKMDYMK
jgi:hypothetical protein